jgi:hypothetical protein
MIFWVNYPVSTMYSTLVSDIILYTHKSRVWKSMDIGSADPGSINGLPVYETYGSVRVIVVCVIVVCVIVVCVIVVCVIQNKSLSPATSKNLPCTRY